MTKGRAKLVNIGFGNMVNSDRIIAIIGADSSPVKRQISEARDSNRLVDATCGRRTRAVVVMDSNQVVLSALQPETIANRFNGRDMDKSLDEVEDE